MEASLLNEFPELREIERPSEFAKRILGFNPLPYQEPIIDCPLHQLDGSLVKAGRRCGKSEALSVWSVIHPTLEPLNVFVLSPSERQSQWFREKVKRHIYHSKYLPFLTALKPDSKWIVKDNEDGIRFANGSTLTTLPCPPDAKSIRGLGFDAPGNSGLIIIDESAQIPPFVLDVVRASTLKGAASTCYVSTPRGQQGQFFDTYQFFAGKIKEGSGNYRIFEFSCWDALKAGHLTLEKIEAERALLSADLFRQEIEGQFVSEFGRVFDPDSVRQCLDARPEPPDRGSRYIQSLDLGYEFDAAQHYTLKISRDFRELTLVDACGFINQKAKEKEPKYAGYIGISSYTKIRDYIIGQCERYPTLCILIDCTNQSGLADLLKSDHRLPVQKMKFSRVSKSIYMQDLSAALRAGTIHIWKGSELERQLYSYSYEMDEGKMRLTTTTDNDCVDSLALSCQYLQKTSACLRPATYLTTGKRESIWA